MSLVIGYQETNLKFFHVIKFLIA